MRAAVSILLLSLILSPSSAQNTTNGVSSSLETDEKVYDTIVVGAGAAGCPLARTLADYGEEVLLLERGDDRQKFPEALTKRGGQTAMLNPVISEQFETVQGVVGHIGRVTGGGTAVNAGVYIEEGTGYFDDLERNYGVTLNRTLIDESFAWLLGSGVVKPSSQDGQWNTALRASLEAEGYEWAGDEGTPQVGYDNAMVWRTYSIFDAETDKRHAADELLEGSNVTLQVLSEVQHLEFDEESADGAKLTATCVVYDKLSDTEGTERSRRRVCVRDGGRIILSAGAIHTPAILMRSGLGPKEMLEAAGIDVVKDMPNVGKDLHDHPQTPIGVGLKAPGPVTIQSIMATRYAGPKCDAENPSPNEECHFILIDELSQGYGITTGMALTAAKGAAQGKVTRSAFSLLKGFWECAHDFDIALKEEEVDPDTDAAEAEAPPICNDQQAEMADCTRQGGSLLSWVTDPLSRGSVSLAANGSVVVDPKYFDHPMDRQAAALSIKEIVKLLVSDDMRNITANGEESCFASDLLTSGLISSAMGLIFPPSKYAPADADLQLFPRGINASMLDTDDSPETLEEIFLSVADPLYISIWHYCGTVSMGTLIEGDDFLLTGTSNVHVVDASVIPAVTRVNPMATIMMLGRYAGVQLGEKRETLRHKERQYTFAVARAEAPLVDDGGDGDDGEGETVSGSVGLGGRVWGGLALLVLGWLVLA
ncbi:unnamed protein product [Vitrella brassicaformis CCMP3155]|uniref:Glucose-methanol-choline oxidoreductase N-terminal domain-containing protein n=3 Tax=Vitrella brassicaformis TaxID=1169539 RepID=A0A0G4EUH7_VITBC|nr:unnamed protein product [Vitrella brassicaformis CCMP3155]|eukprot:CEM01741.1 unnamed protein product [Vitrella brassicaformis CCMP3155]